MRISIVGGNGQVARHLHSRLLGAGHTPVALVRTEERRSDLEALGAEVRILDIEGSDAAAFAEAFAGSDAVVFAAGGGPDGNIERKRTVDLEGSLKSIDAATALGIGRFVQVSAIAVDEPVADDASDVWRAYVTAKRDADAALRASTLDWTIIRPGLLTDEDGSGLVSLAPELPRGPIPREDVAAVVAAVLDHEETVGHQWTLTTGLHPITDAIAATARAERNEQSRSI